MPPAPEAMAEPGLPPTTAPGRERQRRRPEGLPRPALGDTQTQREPRGSERELRVRAARKAVAAAVGPEMAEDRRQRADPRVCVCHRLYGDLPPRLARAAPGAVRPSSTARCWRLLFSRPGRRCRSPGRRRRPPTPPLCALRPPRRRRRRRRRRPCSRRRPRRRRRSCAYYRC